MPAIKFHWCTGHAGKHPHLNDKDPPRIRRYFRVLGTRCDKMCLALSALGGDLDYDPYHQHPPLQKESAGRGGGGRRKRGRGGSGRKGES